MRGTIKTAVFAMCAVTMMAGIKAAHAQSEVHWRGVALQRASLQWTEKWEWLRDELRERSGGRFNLDIVSFAELGLAGNELIRLLNTGLVDAADVVTGYVSGEVPLMEGVQLPGVYADYDQAREGYLAWSNSVVLPREAAMGGKVVGSFAFASQYLWTKFPIDDLDDLRGKKIRIFATAQADYLAAFGAEPVNISLAELYTALERGTVDGAVTGPEYARGVKLWEVTTHVTDLQMGVGAGFVVVSRRSWDALSEDDQKLIEDFQPEIIQRGWDLGARDTEDGLRVALENGINATIPPKEEWRERLNQVARDVVVRNWVERAGPDGRDAFNEQLAPIVGYTID